MTSPTSGADEIVAGAGGGITVNVLSVDQAGEPSARLFQPYSGGSQSSICVGVNRFTQNAFGGQVRCARHLLTDLNDSSASRIGWPLYWTKDGVFLFSDSTGKSGPRNQSQYYNLIPPANFDYESLTRAAAAKMVKDQEF